MTVEEAVALVLQAGSVGDNGEVLVLDMGAPVCIKAVAERLIRRSGSHIDLVYTGLRPGEKLHEVLLGEDEPDVRPNHPLISQVPVPPLATTALSSLNGLREQEVLRDALDALTKSPPSMDQPQAMNGTIDNLQQVVGQRAAG